MRNNFIYSVLKSSWHQLLDSGIKSRMFHLKKIDNLDFDDALSN